MNVVIYGDSWWFMMIMDDSCGQKSQKLSLGHHHLIAGIEHIEIIPSQTGGLWHIGLPTLIFGESFCWCPTLCLENLLMFRSFLQLSSEFRTHPFYSGWISTCKWLSLIQLLLTCSKAKTNGGQNLTTLEKNIHFSCWESSHRSVLRTPHIARAAWLKILCIEIATRVQLTVTSLHGWNLLRLCNLVLTKLLRWWFQWPEFTVYTSAWYSFIFNQFANWFSYVLLMKPPTRQLLNHSPHSYPLSYCLTMLKHRWTMSNASILLSLKLGCTQNCYVHLRRMIDKPSISHEFCLFFWCQTSINRMTNFSTNSVYQILIAHNMLLNNMLLICYS